MWVGTGFVGHGFYSSGASWGAFVNGRTVRYEGGEVHAIHNIDIDSWSYFEALELVRDLGYSEKVNLWWNVARGRMNRTFRRITRDSHALEMGHYALLHKCEVDLYVEHTQVSQPILLEEGRFLTYNNDDENEKVEGDGIGGAGDTNLDEGEVEQGGVDDELNAGSDSDDDTDDVHFSDSEEDRDLGMDYGFEDVNDEQNVVKERKMKTKTTLVKNPILTPSKRARKMTPKRGKRKIFEGQCSGVNGLEVDPEVFIPPNVVGKDTIDEDYLSDELHSDLDDNCGFDHDKPKYPTYQKEEMCKQFKFTLGMEFRSLKEFKDVILEHSVLNGREVVFVKNDSVRVRVKCKRDCQFMAFT
ncbi:Transposase, MuDR, plant [Sesbania bispinosa]|nr:Transposase, MuDR, plant [Sesbania bispinosa]